MSLADLKSKRRELKLLCRVKTSQAQMFAYRESFLSQADLTEEEIIEADL